MLDFKEFETMLESMKSVQKDHKEMLERFLIEMAGRTMRQTKKLTPVDSGNLRARWELGVVVRKGDDLWITIYNPVKYASHVEDGHMQRRRFVPGYWEGKKFRFAAYTGQGPRAAGDNYKSGGMMLRTKWIEGQYMARISINKIQKEIPKRYEKAFRILMNDWGLGD